MDYTPVEVKQIFPASGIKNLEAVLAGELEKTGLIPKLKKGMKVAVLAGSRGINDISLIIKTVVKVIKRAGGVPSIVAAMGSHGGGTAAGQREILAHLGITEMVMECPVFGHSDSFLLGQTLEGYPVYVSCAIKGFDGIIAVNRVKPHTSFKGDIESGLLKMLSVGLGGPQGAVAVHAQGIKGLHNMVPSIARFVLKSLPVWGGLAIVEDAYEKTYQVAGVNADNMEQKEKELLYLAKKLMPFLPFREIDILVVEKIGKNYSGTGMDTNVIGRMRIQGEPEPESPRIKRIVALDLSGESQGNATGIGLADFTTKKLVEKIDFSGTYLNCLTSTFVQRAMVPMVLANEDEAILTAVRSLGNISLEKARIVRIANTLALDRFRVSDSLKNEVMGHPQLSVIPG